MLRSRLLAGLALGSLLSVVLLPVGCTDENETTSGDGAGGNGSGPTTSPATTSSATGGSGGSGGTGGEGASGGAGGAGGAGGCPDILILDGMAASCADVGANALPLADTTLCPTDSGVFWPAKVYAVPVEAGDCLYMQADNVGSPLGADLFGAIVEPGGKSVLLDEEIDCSVTNPEGYTCPAGGATMEASGTAYVMVGTWEGEGCTAGDPTPFELAVAIDGVDVDLSSSAVCAGDLLEIIP